MAALTDSTNCVSYEPETRPGVSNLLQLWSHFDSEGRSPEVLASSCSGMGLKAFKTKVADAIAESLAPVRRKYEEFMKEDGGAYIDFVEKDGARRARGSAEETMMLVREAVGL